MNTPLPASTRWSRDRWGVVIAALFLAHVGVIAWLEDHAPRRFKTGAPRLMAGLVLDAEMNQRVLDTYAVADPTLFAFAKPRAATSGRWRELTTLDNNAATERETVPNLAPAVTQLGSVFREFVATNTVSIAPLPDKPAVSLAPLVMKETAVTTQSTLSFQSGIVQRTLLETVKLKSWPHTNLLADTTVQIFVTAAGDVLSPRLLSVGGGRDAVQQTADQHALEVARGLRFQPLNDSAALMSGTLQFHWHVTTPKARQP